MVLKRLFALYNLNMKNLIRLWPILLVFCFVSPASAQWLDHYGLKVGMGLANQYWDYPIVPELTKWRDTRTGFAAYVNAEKRFGKIFVLRPELGYVQKGFEGTVVFSDLNGTTLKEVTDNVTLHNLALNLSAKIDPLEGKFQPYLILGLHFDYLMDYDDFQAEFDDITYGVYSTVLEKFESLTVHGLIGAGVSFNQTLYLDLEYQPALTNNLDTDELVVHDRYVSCTIGVNVDQLFKKTDEE